MSLQVIAMVAIGSETTATIALPLAPGRTQNRVCNRQDQTTVPVYLSTFLRWMGLWSGRLAVKARVPVTSAALCEKYISVEFSAYVVLRH